MKEACLHRREAIRSETVFGVGFRDSSKPPEFGSLFCQRRDDRGVLVDRAARGPTPGGVEGADR